MWIGTRQNCRDSISPRRSGCISLVEGLMSKVLNIAMSKCWSLTGEHPKFYQRFAWFKSTQLPLRCWLNEPDSNWICLGNRIMLFHRMRSHVVRSSRTHVEFKMCISSLRFYPWNFSYHNTPSNFYAVLHQIYYIYLFYSDSLISSF